MLASDFGVMQVFWSMVWFFLFFMWIMIVFRVFGDLFRDKETSGFGKVLWCIFIIFLPFLGVFVYLIARGNAMAEREVASIQAQDAAAKAVHPRGRRLRATPTSSLVCTSSRRRAPSPRPSTPR